MGWCELTAGGGYVVYLKCTQTCRVNVQVESNLLETKI